MSTANLRRTKSGIEDALKATLNRLSKASAYADRVIWPQYQKAQIERWQTENSSQGETWEPLTPQYKKQKRKRFAAYPGAGNALMVATGRLAQGAQGQNPAYFNKLITDKQFVVAVNTGALPYAKYPGVKRPFMVFNQETIDFWTKGLTAYLMRGRA
jgi:hypothetical protein